MDDDCDGATDEELGLGMPCDGATDTDACKEGTIVCDGAGGTTCMEDPGDGFVATEPDLEDVFFSHILGLHEAWSERGEFDV